MQKKAARRTMPALLAAACALALAAACALAFPATALAEETGVAHTVDSNGMRHYYATVNEAKEAGYSGATVYMDADWNLGSGSLDIADSKSLTIQMAGHKITSSNKDATIYLNEHASVTITSYEDAKEYSFSGFAQNGSSWEWQDLTISASGLITNTNRDIWSTSLSGTRYSSCGIHLEGSSSLSLENVAVVGCPDRGIDAGSKCNLTLTNAKVCYNRTPSDGDRSNGAGVSIKSGSILSVNASHIDNNYASEALGGGIYAEKSTTVALENGSTVSNNLSGAGGGIYFSSTYFTLKSDDRSGVVSGNTAWKSSEAGTDAEQSGGGIHVNSATGDNKGTIEGITIKDNYSRYDGGGIELDQRWTTVKNCIITGNHSDYDGGGIYVNGGNNTIESCTIRDNYCNGIGKNQEGGGIFVSCHYDVKMAGTCVVKDNTRGKDSGNADDVFLSTLSGGGAKAYIKGGLDQGSSVGVRTGIGGDRRIASGFNPESKDCLFIDLGGYYVSYGTDEGGDAWQRHTTKEFAAKINGKSLARYKQGTKATLVAPSTIGDDLVFWHWDLDKTTGLYPIGDYITNEAAFNNTLTFKMPQNDVDAVPVYATRAKNVGVAIEAPAASEALPASAGVYRLDGAGLRGPFDAAVTWYEVASDGSQTRASGVAKAGTVYAAEVSLGGNDKYGLFFSSSISAQDVKLIAGSGSGSVPTVESASVDAGTGRLTIKTGAFEKTAGEAAETKTGTVKVSCEGKSLLGGDGQATAALSLASNSDAGSQPLSDGGSLGEVEVSYAYSDGSDKVTITAPHVPGYNFCNWENVGPGWIKDDVEGIVTIPASDLKNVDVLVAYYTPTATGLEVSLDAPVGGKELATEAADVKGTCSDGSEVDFAHELGVKSFKVTWSPESEDGTADYSTTYTALVELCDAEGVTGVENVLAQNAVVTCGGVAATSAGFVVTDGKLCLALAFPATDAVKATSVSQPTDVELTFEQAAGYAAEQASHPDALCWPLPSTVSVTLENGEVADGDVTWEIPTSFNANAAAAQEIPVRGTVSIAYPDEVDASGVSLDVTTTIKVAAPSQGGSNNSAASSTDNGNGSAGAASTLAKTNDSVPTLVMGAVAGIALIAVVVAVVAALYRRKR